jgi:hypothetical protein
VAGFLFNDETGCSMMKRIMICVIALGSFAVFSIAQDNTELQNIFSPKTVQTYQKKSLNKKTKVQPLPPTNWSKIKDLFR